MEKLCINCRFFVTSSEPVTKFSHGNCYFNPPVPLPISAARIDQSDRDSPWEFQIKSMWPEVMGFLQCGHWEQ